MGIIGDAYDEAEVARYVDAVREIEASYPDAELVIVPKCRVAIEAIPDDIVLGYSRGYADRLAHEFSDPRDWRGRRVHILRGSPPKQRDVVDQLTRPSHTGDLPADTVGLDWNSAHRGAQFSEFWTAGTIVAATLTTSPSAKLSGRASDKHASSGRHTASGQGLHLKRRG